MRDPSETPIALSPDRESAPIPTRGGLSVESVERRVPHERPPPREKIVRTLSENRVHHYPSQPAVRESPYILLSGKTWHWGPPPVKRLLTSQPHPSPPRRRHCAQVRFRSIRVATTCEFPHPFFRARVDHHPTHHPPPPQIGPVGPTNQQGPRARVDARLARAPLGRLDSCNPRARRTRRFEVGRRRSAHVRVERRVSRRSSYHFTHPPNHHEHDSPAPDSRR